MEKFERDAVSQQQASNERPRWQLAGRESFFHLGSTTAAGPQSGRGSGRVRSVAGSGGVRTFQRMFHASTWAPRSGQNNTHFPWGTHNFLSRFNGGHRDTTETAKRKRGAFFCSFFAGNEQTSTVLHSSIFYTRARESRLVW